ncbi:cytochrome C oxidase subunit IV family protein [Amycolatopsis sp. cg5]|uniref:cytochrome C oxidase subunit IV family protein n=1 Tax=Amycolatopsis sp. cg5 TaxID=3238802 RepID=UPI003525EF0A
MIILLMRSVGAVWLVLILATVLSWLLFWASGDRAAAGAPVSSATILIVAFVKARLIALHFMEVREAPKAMRALLDVYCVVVCGVLVYLLVEGA